MQKVEVLSVSAEACDNTQHTEIAPKPKRKPPKTAWKPGFCPNPGGRPPLPEEFKRLAAAHGSRALDVMVELMTEAKLDKVRLDAAQAVANRAYGTPTQHIEAEISKDKVKVLFERYALSVAEVLNRELGADRGRAILADIDRRFGERRAELDAPGDGDRLAGR